MKIQDIDRNELVKYARFRRLDMPDAEDVVQNTFLNFLLYYGDIEVDEGLLHTILKNEINKFNRDKHADGMFTGDAEIRDVLEQPEVCAGDLSKHINKSKNKEVLSLYFNKGYKLAEVSTLLNLHYKKVDYIVYRFKSYMTNRASHA